MWNKSNDEAAAATPRPAGQAAPSSVPPPPGPVSEGRHTEPAAIGASISIVGDVSGSEDLMILGRVEGKVALANHSVTIGRSGRVTADIQAKAVNVEGEVRGNLVASEQILIRKSATMLGNLTAPRVGLEDGCRFKGSVDMEAGSDKARPVHTAAPIAREVSVDSAAKLPAAPRP